MYDDTLFASPMKTLLLALLLVTGSAWAEWVMVARHDTFDKYIDPETIRKDGNLRRVWEIDDLKQRGKSGELSFRFRTEYDCKQERLRMLSLNARSGPMAGGESIHQSSSEDIWRDIPPRSIGEMVLKIVCAK